MSIDLATIREFLSLSVAAYPDEPIPDGWTLEKKFEADTEAFLCTGPAGKKVVAFRGSSSVADFMTDAHVSLFRYEGWPGYWHEGAHDALDAHYGWLLGIFRDNNRVGLTGHSLGGMEAIVAAATALVHGWESSVGPIVTFGSPRVCNRTAAVWLSSAYEGRALRIVNRGDLVTQTPFPFWFRSHVYTHAFPRKKVGKGWDRRFDHPVNAYQEALV